MSDEKEEQPTPRERLFKSHDDLCKRAKALMKAKNEDYARAQDPLFNFRRHGMKGIIVRLDDKMCRLDNIIDKGFASVAEETVDDILLDLINYAVLLSYWRAEEKTR